MIIHRHSTGLRIRLATHLKAIPIIGKARAHVGQISGSEAYGSEIIGHFVTLVASLLLKTANVAIGGY